MAGLSNYAEGKILDHYLGGAAWTAPVPYLALYSATPSDAGGGTELTYTGYARIDLTAKMGAVSGTPRTKANSVQIVGGTNTSASQTATHFGIFDASTAGNLIGWGPLGASIAIGVGTRPVFDIADLVIGQD